MNGKYENMPEPAAPPPIPWTARDAWLGLALFLGLSIITTTIFLLLMWIFSVELSMEIMLIIGEVMFVVPIWWFANRKYGAGWGALGVRGFKWTNIAVGFGLVLAVTVVTGFYSAIIQELFDSPIQPDLEPVAEDMALPWLLIVMAVIVAPLVEEFFFRGFVFAGFRRKYGWQRAAIFSSVLFAVGHLQPYAILPLFLLGYVFAYLYQRSGSIWPGILMHFIVNLWGIIAEFVIAE